MIEIWCNYTGFGRSLTANLIPKGKENDLFSLFAITDKGSSWIGPAIIGVLSNFIGLRLPLIYVLIFFLVSIPLIYTIDIEEGMKQAGRLEEVDGDTKRKDSAMTKKEKELEFAINNAKEDEVDGVVAASTTENSTNETMTPKEEENEEEIEQSTEKHVD